MSAVISLPHGFTVHYELHDPWLQGVVDGMPFTTAREGEEDVGIIIVDDLDSLNHLHFSHAVYLDTSCSPCSVPENTLVLQTPPGLNFNANLISIIATLNQGHGHGLLLIQQQLRSQLDWVTNGLEEAIIWTDEEFEILNLTDSAVSLFNSRPKKLIGQILSEVIQCEEEDLHEMLAKRAAINATEKLEVQGQVLQGEKVFLRVGIKRLVDKRYQLNLIDVSSQRAADKRFIQLANYDPMTGLANRGLLFEFLQRAVGRSKRSGRMIALMLLDMDHFNRVDDDTGAPLGDELLKSAAEKIKSLLHDQDMLARWGGSELAIVMEDLEHPESVSRIAQRVISVLSNPFVIGGKDYYISPSIGIAVYPEADETINGLIQAAGTAMFEAKKDDGLNTYRFYQAKLQQVAEQRAAIEQQLHRALDNNEFEIYYQPKVSISKEKVIGFEALLRWQHPDWVKVSPQVYVPVAEECGLIGHIGDWVLRQSCLKMGQWQRDYPNMKDCSIAVNVSTKQLSDPYFAGKVATILAESKLDADKLELELTESAVMENPEQGIRILNKIHELGVKISIDDFGTGYSSLSYLKKLPIDCIKIDRSFVIDIGLSESTESIIQAILVMSASLGLVNVAEGIETVEQMAFFEGTQCDTLQGYMFSKPLPEADIDIMFSGNKPALYLELSQLNQARI